MAEAKSVANDATNNHDSSLSFVPISESRTERLGSAIAPLAILAALPLVMLLIRPDWIYPRPDAVDPWMYLSYFLRPRFQLGAFPEAYQGSRLPVILPGAMVFRGLNAAGVFRADWALLILHLGLYYGSIFALYYAALQFFDRRTALLTAILAGTYPMFLSAIGQNHADCFGVTYASVTIALIASAVGRRPRRGLLILAGASAACFVFTNLAYLPATLFFVWLLSMSAADRPLPDFGRHCSLMAIGAILATGVLAAINLALGGKAIFFLPAVAAIGNLLISGTAIADRSGAWLLHASWLVIPALVLSAGSALICREALTLKTNTHKQAPTRQLLFGFLGLVLILGVAQAFSLVRYLQYSFYASLLLPALFLAVGGLLYQVVPHWPRRSYRLACLTALSLGSLAAAGTDTGGSGFAAVWLVPLVLAGAGAALLMLPRFGPEIAPPLAIGLIAAAHLVISANHEHLLALAPLERKHVPGGEWVGTWTDPSVPSRAQIVRTVAEAFTAISAVDDRRNLRLWYAVRDNHGSIYNAIGSTYFWDVRWVSPNFPLFTNHMHEPADPQRVFENTLKKDGFQRVGILSLASEPAAATAAAALLPHRLGADLVREQSIGSIGAPIKLTILDVRRDTNSDSMRGAVKEK